MIRFKALGICFTLPLLTLVFPLLAVHLGLQGSISSLMVALALHELAHVLAARWLGVQIQEIRLMPFGGSAHMENPYGVAAGRMLWVAAAGPAANLLLAVAGAAIVQWRWIPPAQAADFIQHNLVLCLFNLLPALPLDGGRILYALLLQRFRDVFALRAVLWLGCVLAAMLLLLTAWGGILHGKWNLSLMLAALFILVSIRDERSALYLSRAQRLCRRDRNDVALPVRFYRPGENTDVRAALSLLRPRQHVCFLLPEGLVCEEDILAHLMRNGAADALLSELVPAIEMHAAAPKA